MTQISKVVVVVVVYCFSGDIIDYIYNYISKTDNKGKEL